MSYVSRIRRRLEDVAAPVFWDIVNPLRRRAANLRDGVARACKTGDRWVSETVARAFGFAEGRLGPLTLLVLAVFGLLAIVFRDWLQTGPEGLESGSTTLRNLSLVIAALIALPLAVWRSKVAERQADAAQRQVETAEQGLLNERYQRGAEMLGSEVLTVRLGGIYALQHLAEEKPDQYHIQIMQLFCAFARHPTRLEGAAAGRQDVENETDARDEEADQPPDLREDVEAVINAIGTRSETGLALEARNNFRLDLRGSNLSWGSLIYEANLSNAELTRADLSWTSLQGANLSGTSFWGANLTGVDLSGANLGGANLYRVSLGWAVLSEAMLSGPDGECPVTGLIQAQLDEARADADFPPRLNGVLGLKTDTPLVWRGKPLDDEE